MSKKRKRKFLLGFVLALCVRSSRVNADLFAEGFMLPGLPKSRPSPPQCRNHDPFRTLLEYELHQKLIMFMVRVTHIMIRA